MFPFCKKAPPSKAEVVKKTVSDAAHNLIDAVPTDIIEDKLDELKKTAVQVALHAAQVAQHAGEVASHKLEEWQHSAEALGETASVAAQRASASAQQASESASAAAAARAKAAKEAAQSAKEAALSARDTLQERALTLKDSATSLRDSLQERAAHDLAVGSKEALNAKAAFEKTAKKQVEVASAKAEAAKAAIVDKKAQWDQKKDEVVAKLPEVPDVQGVGFKSPNIEVEYSDSSSKWQWILLGIAVGALLAILFAPTSGRRSRAAIKDRLGKVGGGVVDATTAAADKTVDIAQRVEGLAHKAEAKAAADTKADDDGTIADRVKSVLGHNDATKHIERLNIDCADGVVTLRGPLLDAQTIETLLAAVKAVPGVKDVVSDLLVDEEPANPANYAS